VIVLRSTRNCSNTPRVRFALDECDEPYRTEEIEDGVISARYGVPGPLLEDGELAVVEIGAILRHVARAYGGGRLLPKGLAQLAEMDRWIDFQGRRIARALGNPPELARLLAVLEQRLDGRDWILGDFTITDCAYLSLALAPPANPPPRVAAYLERLAARSTR
jgi:glutathione S-transferase